ncbi:MULTISPECIES: carboxymuconolactone decarboxylase family protein [Sphingobium]|uniref:carboxymuconolactone decarboxylase family protein n=1 Tax=Sphingobium TaxID=165695 RepID=UPI002101C547|nr:MULTISPECIES: carboxymuconolactone decarboxylase family protein [unclassified Sphingobium]
MFREDGLEALLDALNAPEGDSLSAQERAFVSLGLATSLPCLNQMDIEAAVKGAFRTGASPTQVQEIVSLVSGLGVHSLMVSSAIIVKQAELAGHGLEKVLTPEQQTIWDARVGDDPFWLAMEAELPGFLRSMLLLSTDQFEAFFDYCSVPWKSRTVRAKVKELVALATDAMPTHIFMPGLRLHLKNAVTLGAGRKAIRECVALAQATPAHAGVA